MQTKMMQEGAGVRLGEGERERQTETEKGERRNDMRGGAWWGSQGKWKRRGMG